MPATWQIILYIIWQLTCQISFRCKWFRPRSNEPIYEQRSVDLGNPILKAQLGCPIRITPCLLCCLLSNDPKVKAVQRQREVATDRPWFTLREGGAQILSWLTGDRLMGRCRRGMRCHPIRWIVGSTSRPHVISPSKLSTKHNRTRICLLLTDHTPPLISVRFPHRPVIIIFCTSWFILMDGDITFL